LSGDLEMLETIFIDTALKVAGLFLMTIICRIVDMLVSYNLGQPGNPEYFNPYLLFGGC